VGRRAVARRAGLAGRATLRRQRRHRAKLGGCARGDRWRGDRHRRRAGSLQLRTCAAGPARWRLAARGDPDDATRHALQLGWGLGCYRFDRYKKSTRAPARLVDAFDAETLDLLAACVRVRDLVNTPTEHMGPADLEAWRANSRPGMARR
jgi:leucyl aminopeptidase